MNPLSKVYPCLQKRLAYDPVSGESKSSLVLSIYNMNATRYNRKISQDYRSFEWWRTCNAVLLALLLAAMKAISPMEALFEDMSWGIRVAICTVMFNICWHTGNETFKPVCVGTSWRLRKVLSVVCSDYSIMHTALCIRIYFASCKAPKPNQAYGQRDCEDDDRIALGASLATMAQVFMSRIASCMDVPLRTVEVMCFSACSLHKAIFPPLELRSHCVLALVMEMWNQTNVRALIRISSPGAWASVCWPQHSEKWSASCLLHCDVQTTIKLGYWHSVSKPEVSKKEFDTLRKVTQ